MKLLFAMLVLTIPLAVSAKIHSPRGQELNAGTRMLPMPRVSAAVFPDSMPFLATWHRVSNATGYVLYAGESPGARTFSFPSATNGVLADLPWADRYYFHVVATNSAGEGASSLATVVPELPATHVLLSWPGTNRVTIEATDRLTGVWNVVTNAISPVVFPIVGAARYFRTTQTNQLTIIKQ